MISTICKCWQIKRNYHRNQIDEKEKKTAIIICSKLDRPSIWIHLIVAPLFWTAMLIFLASYNDLISWTSVERLFASVFSCTRCACISNGGGGWRRAPCLSLVQMLSVIKEGYVVHTMSGLKKPRQLRMAQRESPLISHVRISFAFVPCFQPLCWPLTKALVVYVF